MHKQIYHTVRDVAKKSGEIRYEGRPCKKCGSTTRYVKKNDCVACVKESSRVRRVTERWRLKNKARMFKRLYNITLNDFDSLLFRQNGLCAVCSVPLSSDCFRNLSSLTTQAHVDHDHATGYVRGLLCRDCNFGLGFLKDSPQILRNAITYLETLDNK